MNKLVSGLDLEAAVRAMAAQAAVLRGETRPDLVRDEVLAELFVTTVAARGYRIAYVCEGRVWTYAQVHAASDSIARGLVRAGIGPGDVVGLWMPRGVELLIAQIAITKSGAAWLPFDADAPLERIGVCLADASAKALLTDAAHRASAAAAKRPVLISADLDDPGDTTPLDPRGRGLSADHPAYLIYTSGSTGTPEGHRRHASQYLPLPALGQRGLRAQVRRRDVPGAPRSPSTCRWRRSGCPISWAPRCSSPPPPCSAMSSACPTSWTRPASPSSTWCRRCSPCCRGTFPRCG